jgi:hypothetical protein
MELKYIECDTNELEVKDIFGMFIRNGYLLINQRTFLSVWDVSDPTKLQKVAEFRYGEVCLEMKSVGNILYIFGIKWRQPEVHIYILDITDPLHIIQKQKLLLQDKDIQLSTACLNNNERLFAIAGGNKSIIEIHGDGTVEKLFTTDDYFADIIACDNMLITSGNYDGILIFSIENGLKELKRIPSKYQILDQLEWLEEGKSIIILSGDGHVIKIDVSDPGKAKQTKSVKTGVGLCKQFVRIDNTIYVLGTAIESRKHPPKICELDISSVPTVLKNKYTIKGYKPKSTGHDSTRGIIKTRNYFLVATYYCELGVVEIIQ